MIYPPGDEMIHQLNEWFGWDNKMGQWIKRSKTRVKIAYEIMLREKIEERKDEEMPTAHNHVARP